MHVVRKHDALLPVLVILMGVCISEGLSCIVYPALLIPEPAPESSWKYPVTFLALSGDWSWVSEIRFPLTVLSVVNVSESCVSEIHLQHRLYLFQCLKANFGVFYFFLPPTACKAKKNSSINRKSCWMLFVRSAAGIKPLNSMPLCVWENALFQSCRDAQRRGDAQPLGNVQNDRQLLYSSIICYEWHVTWVALSCGGNHVLHSVTRLHNKSAFNTPLCCCVWDQGQDSEYCSRQNSLCDKLVYVLLYKMTLLNAEGLSCRCCTWKCCSSVLCILVYTVYVSVTCYGYVVLHHKYVLFSV